MSEDATGSGWFATLDRDDTAAAVTAIRTGSAPEPADWPAMAVESGFAEDEADYYSALHDATVAAARAAATERERSGDQQLVHAVRAMDDCLRTANELAERVSEWANALFDDDRAGIPYARDLADREPDHPDEAQVVSLAGRVADLADEADELEEYVETRAPEIAPNLAAMAGPVLAARLISLAGGLESLAKKPSGTVQVLGAEDALFAHLRGHASSPKHGVIFTHEYVRGTRPQDRGSAARALAGKLSIAARVDHYSGDRKPELDEELDARIATIQARAEDGNGGESGGDGE
ncbi:NOP5/NOP56 family protein [Haloarchaeobius sp. HME9146]|uniref:NOP5/NOP56 family protein n=1 Tax=Haloarchaeobius sp. HME9146 TaxID=2978732 RepID=UPI0021BE6E2D|nr:NOP5/NOP56 family protein [Haloarchaeobius sp. HME9146]MCT9096871.1 NOP58 family protein [Haloarchaeobius sp. HME9146]